MCVKDIPSSFAIALWSSSFSTHHHYFPPHDSTYVVVHSTECDSTVHTRRELHERGFNAAISFTTFQRNLTAAHCGDRETEQKKGELEEEEPMQEKRGVLIRLGKISA